jgi:hypothetical protein
MRKHLSQREVSFTMMSYAVPPCCVDGGCDEGETAHTVHAELVGSSTDGKQVA